MLTTCDPSTTVNNGFYQQLVCPLKIKLLITTYPFEIKQLNDTL
jgi:hypothetical protein